MLSRDTQRTIIDAMRRGLDPSSADPAVPIPLDHPEYDRYDVHPTLRFRWMDVDPPDPPYVLVTFDITEGDVGEPQGVSDEGGGRVLDIERLAPDVQDADLRVTKGRPVRDVLEVMATAEGGVDVPGAPADSDTDYLTADDRADAVARGIRDFLVEDFPERPLDAFDDEGNAVDTSQLIYGEDLSPPVQVTPIEGRGVDAMPEGLSETDAQFNTGVNLHYFDTSEHYEYVPESAGIGTDVTTETRHES